MSSTIHVSGPGIDRRVTLDEGAGEMTVGRDAAADVHLPDPEKAISRKHLAIRLHGGAIEFRVVSSINGVTSSKGEVPPGATGVLQAGEQLTLGSYTLLAVAGGAAAPPPADATSMTSVTRTRTPGGDPLDVFSALGPRTAARSDDPFSRPEFNPAPLPKTSSGADPFEALLGKPKPPPKPVGALPSAGAGAGGNAKGPDPMALLSGNQQQVVKQTGAGQINEWLTPGSSTGAPGAHGAAGMLPPGFGGPSRHDGRPPAGPLSTDHVHDFNLPLKLPTAPGAAASATAAADPWAALQSELAVPAAAPVPPPPPPPVPIPAPPPVMAPVAAPALAARPPAPPMHDDDPFASLEQAFGDDPFSEWTSSATGSTAMLAAALVPPASPQAAAPEAAAPLAVAAAAPAPAPAASAAAASAAPGADGTLVAALFAGLGLPVPKDFNAAGALHIGAMTRLIVEGFADLLAARAALKRELRAEDRTMLNARGNNPLKLGLTTDQLLQFLFASSGASAAAYMPPQRAMKETVTELRAHEIATIAASRAAVQGAIQDFEPVKLKAKLTKGKTKLPQFLGNARLWDMYEQHYQEQEQQMADWLDKLFDRHFMPVYSKESDRLRSAMEAADLSDPVPRPR